MIVLSVPRVVWADGDRLPGPIPARVLRVVDGDTVMVRARIWLGQDVETSVRLAGIDTPEKRGKCDAERAAADQAEAFVAGKLTTDEWVTLRDVIADKYGKRVVARMITAKGEDMAALLIANKLAREYGGRAKQSWCD
ncbi:hypothetical protein MSR1_27520 [Magnetospirillum gryphiswaldense MSR-1]|nr:hypothetical protein MSR1_27520 [Magnetospirillum gryphiswaldense MSR-1]AVM79125.1 hypothetical protein MSR1L_27520 [Magnetospirillum gryphiswaldense]